MLDFEVTKGEMIVLRKWEAFDPTLISSGRAGARDKF